MGLKAGELSLSIILLLFLFFIFQFYVIPIIIAFGVLLGKTSKIQRKTKRSAFEMMMQGSNKSYKDETLILENLKSKSHENP